MASVREPLLHPVAIQDLGPTQITVGMREVGAESDLALHLAKSMDADDLPAGCGPVAR